MKIHTNTLTRDDMHEAARLAGVTFHRLEERGSRSRVRAFDVILEGTSGRQGQAGGYDAATWDEWGIFLAEAFRRDPAAHCSPIYESAEHFHWSTGGRYRDMTPAGQHRRHRWEARGRSATGSYYVHECACGAVRRLMARGHAFAEIAA